MKKKKIKLLKIDTIKSRLRTSKIIVAIAAATLFVNATFLYMEAEADTIQDAKWDLHLTSKTGPMEVIMDMHEMTHQKVEADHKWGAIPMSQDTIMQIYNFVYTSPRGEFNDDPNFYGDKKEILLSILDKWKKGNFDDIVSDHNTLWRLLDGNVGEATGKATKEQEAEYVVLHFGNKLKLFK